MPKKLFMDASRVKGHEPVGSVKAQQLREAKDRLAAKGDKMFPRTTPVPFCIRAVQWEAETMIINTSAERTGRKMNFSLFCEYITEGDHTAGIIEAILGYCSFAISIRAEGSYALIAALEMLTYLQVRCKVGADKVDEEVLENVWKGLMGCLIKYG